jgi:hypothetical protein
MATKISARLHHHQKGLALKTPTVSGLNTSGQGSSNPHARQSWITNMGSRKKKTS